MAAVARSLKARRCRTRNSATCTDSGGPLEFVVNEKTGLITEPTPKALASALDRIWESREQARLWGQAGRAHYDSFDIHWDNVVRKLLA